MAAVWQRLNEETGEVERRTPAEMHDAVFGIDEAEEQLRREGYVWEYDEG